MMDYCSIRNEIGWNYELHTNVYSMFGEGEAHREAAWSGTNDEDGCVLHCHGVTFSFRGRQTQWTLA